MQDVVPHAWDVTTVTCGCSPELLKRSWYYIAPTQLIIFLLLLLLILILMLILILIVIVIVTLILILVLVLILILILILILTLTLILILILTLILILIRTQVALAEWIEATSVLIVRRAAAAMKATGEVAPPIAAEAREKKDAAAPTCVANPGGDDVARDP